MLVWTACTADYWEVHEASEEKRSAARAALRNLARPSPAPVSGDTSVLVQCFSRDKLQVPPLASWTLIAAMCVFLEQWLAWRGMHARARAWASDVCSFWQELLEVCASSGCQVVAALPLLPGYAEMREACDRRNVPLGEGMLLERARRKC